MRRCSGWCSPAERLPGRGIGVTAVALTVLVIGGTVANGLHIDVPSQDSATVKLTDPPSAPVQRMVSADVQTNPPGAISDDPDWLTALAWQGKMNNERGLVIDRLTEVGQALRVESSTPGVGLVEDVGAYPGRPNVGRGADRGTR